MPANLNQYWATMWMFKNRNSAQCNFFYIAYNQSYINIKCLFSVNLLSFHLLNSYSKTKFTETSVKIICVMHIWIDSIELEFYLFHSIRSERIWIYNLWHETLPWCLLCTAALMFCCQISLYYYYIHYIY